MSTTFTFPSSVGFIDAAESTADGSISGLVVLALAVAVVVLLSALSRDIRVMAGVLAVVLGCIARAVGAIVVVALIFVLLVLAIAGGGSARANGGGPAAPTNNPVPVVPGGPSDAPLPQQPTG
jgi:hypothetical protein